MSSITLVDADRQWFKSVLGSSARQTHRNVSFCAHAMLGDEVMVVPDATLDPRFAANPLVTGEPHIRFYAGAPLRTPEGHALGALCLIDYRPRHLSRAERRMLLEMAALVEDELLLRRAATELGVENFSSQPANGTPDAGNPMETGRRSKRRSPQAKAHRRGCIRGAVRPENGIPADENRFRHIVEQADDAIVVCDLQGRFLEANTAASRLFGYEKSAFLRSGIADLEIGFSAAKRNKRWLEMGVGEAETSENLYQRQDGSFFWAEVRSTVVETHGGRYLLARVRDVTERRQAETSLQMRARQQRAVAKLGLKALRSTQVGALLDEAVAVVGETLEIEFCRVLERVPEREEFVTRAGLNLPEEERGRAAAPDGPQHAAGYVWRTGEPVIIRDALNDPRFLPSPWLKACGGVSGLHVSIGGDSCPSPCYGVLAAYTREARAFNDDDVSFVQSVANVLAAAITRQRGDDALRAVEARYQRIAARTPGVVYQCLLRADGTLEFPFISEACRQLYGLEPQEIQAHPERMITAVHAEDRPAFKATVAETKRTLTPLHWQGRIVQQSGEIRWVRLDSIPERLPDGNVICDGIIVDITEEEQQRDALRQSEKRFRLANLHSPFPIMLFTDDGEVLLINDAWIHQSGYRPEDIRTVEDWLRRAYATEEAREEERRFLEDLAMHVGTVAHPARRIRCDGGEERVWDLSAANLGRSADGRWLRIATAVDVTKNHRQEAALRLAKEEAERANAAKSVFLSRMSHELRTPLNAILGFGQILELGSLDGDDRQSVSQIIKGGRHLLALVDEVLDLARVEAGELDLTLTAVSLQKLARECVNLVARTAQGRGVICKLATHGPCQKAVLADESRLRQVLLNLLSNAIKYNRVGGQVVLDCEYGQDRQSLRLKVTDNGNGISAEGLAQLFVPFERLGQEFGKVEGTGLGLVVSKQLVEAMNGRIGAESTPGEGSMFWIELPMAGGEKSVASKAVRPAKRTLGLAGLAKPTLLYVEDNESNVQVLKMVVARLRPDWNFLFEIDGVSGLRCARAKLPDVILLDLQLPHLNGDALLVELKTGEDTRHIPIMMLSADAMAHSRERLLSLGADDYLPKPFNVNDLLERLDALLGTVARRSHRRQTATAHS